MSRFLDVVKKQVLLGDGAMGTMLVENGLPAGESPEVWMLSYPEKVKAIHQAYLAAGSEVIQTNTFGANRLKLQDYQADHLVEKINLTAARLTKEATGGKAFVAGIIGPTGHLPAPLGEIPWQELVEVFAEQAIALEKGGVDFIFFETFSDLGEIRAALYAVKKYTKLPAACSLTYTKGRTLTGTSPEVAAIVLSAMGADLLGANCSTGPEELLEVMKAYRAATDLPLLVEPNAGIPEIVDGQTVFKASPELFAKYTEPFRQAGVNLIGACCGSTPDHIKAMGEALLSREPIAPSPAPWQLATRLASRSKAVCLGGGELPRIIGERINPTARKAIAQAYRDNHYDLILEEGLAQVEAGAELLDVNTGVPGLQEELLLPQAVQKLQMALDVPLVLDCTNPQALEKALQYYHGKALINSVNGEAKSLETILPLAKKYGAAVLGLTLNERGIPEKAEERLAIARTIVQKAQEYGIPKEDIIIDCLVLTVATNPSAAMETVRAIALVKQELGVTTTLGLSNVSHGLPQRSWLNAAFLALALGNGLDSAIANPLDNRIMETLLAGALLTGRDPGARNYLAAAGQSTPHAQTRIKTQEASLTSLQACIFSGQREPIPGMIEELLAKHDTMTIINQGIVPPLEKMGDLFAQGEAFLPQLMLAGDAARSAFEHLKSKLPAGSIATQGTVVIGTVQGDIHDIGKNIVSALLENHGFRVIDLGKNVAPELFVSTAQREKAQIIALSALMTTTAPGMAQVIKQVRQAGLACKILVGGAVVTPDYARQIGADGYGKDAVEAVRVALSLLKEG